MAHTFYDSELTGEEIEAALEAIDGLIVPANNGRVIAVENGTLVAKSVSDYTDQELQSKTVTPSASQQTVTPDSGYYGLSSVTVNGDEDLAAGNIKKDVEIFGVTGTYEGGTTPTGTISITQNGTVDVSNYATADVNVPDRELEYAYTLPSEYQEVEYVSFSSGQFVSLPYSVACEVFIKGQDDSTDSDTLQRCVAGFREGSPNNADWNARLPRETSVNRFFFSRSNAYNALVDVEDNGDNSVSSIWFTISRRNLSSDSIAYLGKYYQSTDVTGGSPFVGKVMKTYMQYCNAASGMRVFIHYLVPCYRKADNVIGFYDVVNSTFYTNEGRGTFGKGPDVN